MSQAQSGQTTPQGGTKLVIVAVVLALFAVVVLNLYVAQVRRAVEQDSFEVCVLTRSLMPGDKIKKEDVKTVRVPKSFKDSLNTLSAMEKADLDSRIDSMERVERPASAGSIVTFPMFQAPEGRRDLDKNIKPGFRLVSLPVNSRTVPGALREGMMVDIEAPFNLGGALPVTLPVMERVHVIAVGARTVYDDTGTPGRQRVTGSYNSITLEVTPDEATDLSMIERLASGEFEIQVRNPTDTDTPKIKTGGINPEVLDLIDRKHHEAPPAKR
ncbi:MAG: Flp pilus assembly protein CpaB [Planctomycetes bacterium]|nr:Flp pilus assembly protein CpaB [Planctomycetota bacterium]